MAKTCGKLLGDREGTQPTQRSGEEPESGVNASPYGPRGAQGDMLSSVVGKAASSPFIRHCENTPFSVPSLLSHLFVCLILILSLKQNVQGIVSFCFCEKRGLCSTRGQGDPGRGHRRGHGRSPQTLLPLARARELSGSLGT